MKKNIGLQVPIPKEACTDKKCPFHGEIPLRGRMFTGNVLKVNLNNTVMIGWERQQLIPKYERYEKRRSKMAVHKPGCINVNVGDSVTVMETRPLSKTKTCVIIEVNQ